MCYDVTSATYAKLKYARHRGGDPDYLDALQAELDLLMSGMPANYHASGFSHPKLLVFTNLAPFKPQAFSWGLIPSWTKDREAAKTISNITLNARGETIFDKPSFRAAAKSKRCLIMVDSFFEHHHLGKQTFPFRIALKNEEPITLAGLWEEWTDKETGELVQTCSIVTTVGNEVMSKIHNNPKAEGPRMPVILPQHIQDKWLEPINSETDKQAIQNLIQPYDANELVYHPVRRLKGKEAIGNQPLATEPFEYAELALLGL